MSDKIDQKEITENLLGLPEKNQNNVWYPPFLDTNNTVLVFVHGILGDSRETWFYEDKTDSKQNTYWPRLISEDEQFKNASIFLGGYMTEFDSLKYDGRHAARELFTALKSNKGALPNPEIHKVSKTVMEHKNLLFITHSTGGIIVRYLLYHEREAFKDKTVGLALIASPSYGSQWADRLTPLLGYYGNKLSKQLQWNSGFLNQLHDNFKDLVGAGGKRLPYMVGQEAIENQFVIHSKWWWPSKSLIVEPESAAQYFPSPKMLPGTDHFSTVKPDGTAHPGYDFVSTFFVEKYKPLISERAYSDLNTLVVQAKSLKEKFESIDDYPLHRPIILKEAEPLAEQILGLDDAELLFGDQIDKYRYATLCFLMSATFDPNEEKRTSLGVKAKQYAEETLSLIENAENLTPNRKGYSKKIVKWIGEERLKDYTLHLKAIALAILAQKTGSGVTIEMVKQTFSEISSGFQELYPANSNPDLKRAFESIKPEE